MSSDNNLGCGFIMMFSAIFIAGWIAIYNPTEWDSTIVFWTLFGGIFVVGFIIFAIDEGLFTPDPLAKHRTYTPPPKSPTPPPKSPTPPPKPPQKKEEPIVCPKCQSSQLAASKQGYGIGKGLVGLAFLGPLGLAAGAVGSKNIKKICLKCGHEWT